eukprot:scaffold1422_cov297-Prasinococcus_capsulatus_cf.AAC.3
MVTRSRSPAAADSRASASGGGPSWSQSAPCGALPAEWLPARTRPMRRRTPAAPGAAARAMGRAWNDDHAAAARSPCAAAAARRRSAGLTSAGGAARGSGGAHVRARDRSIVTVAAPRLVSGGGAQRRGPSVRRRAARAAS